MEGSITRVDGLALVVPRMFHTPLRIVRKDGPYDISSSSGLVLRYTVRSRI